jgi:hypothetical protein
LIGCLAVINNDHERAVTQERILRIERQVAQIHRTETNMENYRMSAGGPLAEIDRMNLEIRDYLWSHPTERSPAAV